MTSTTTCEYNNPVIGYASAVNALSAKTITDWHSAATPQTGTDSYKNVSAVSFASSTCVTESSGSAGTDLTNIEFLGIVFAFVMILWFTVWFFRPTQKI